VWVMPIVALLQKAAFDPETTHILATAFDKVWDKFKSSGSGSKIVRPPPVPQDVADQCVGRVGSNKPQQRILKLI